jgi:hypothetical protein
LPPASYCPQGESLRQRGGKNALEVSPRRHSTQGRERADHTWEKMRRRRSGVGLEVVLHRHGPPTPETGATATKPEALDVPSSVRAHRRAAREEGVAARARRRHNIAAESLNRAPPRIQRASERSRQRCIDRFTSHRSCSGWSSGSGTSFPVSPSSPANPWRDQARWTELLPLPLLIVLLPTVATRAGEDATLVRVELLLSPAILRLDREGRHALTGEGGERHM